jgi:hypothetical protein
MANSMRRKMMKKQTARFILSLVILVIAVQGQHYPDFGPTTAETEHVCQNHMAAILESSGLMVLQPSYITDDDDDDDDLAFFETLKFKHTKR